MLVTMDGVDDDDDDDDDEEEEEEEEEYDYCHFWKCFVQIIPQGHIDVGHHLCSMKLAQGLHPTWIIFKPEECCQCSKGIGKSN